MAKITFTLQELLDIIVSNEILPRQIARLNVKEDRIHFVIKTNAFILPFIPASLGYVRFDGNKAVFELTLVNDRMNKAMGMFQHALTPKLPEFVTLEYPNVFVDIDRLFKEKNIRGIQIRDIALKYGEFSIETGHTQTKET